MKTTACILLLAAAAWAQEVAVPQGGSLGPSCKLSDAATLGADKVDGSHGSATPAANTVPVADSNGKLAPGWIPLPTGSSIGGIFMSADCLAGNHVNGIDPASGQLKCAGDAADWSNVGNKPSAFPPDTSSQAWQDLLAALALKAPSANAALTGTTTAEQIVAATSVQVGSGTPAVNFSYGTDAPTGACTAGMYWRQVSADTVATYSCNAGAWTEETTAASQLADPGSSGVLKRTTANTTAVAGYADIVGLFNSGTCSGYLKSTGGCDVPVSAGNIVGPDPAASVDSEIALFAGTGGRTLKRATGTGFVKLTSGVMEPPAALAAADLPAALANSTSINGVAVTSGKTLMYTDTSVAKGQTPLTNKGDLWVTDGNAMHRLGVGTNGQVLVADSTQTDGLAWGASASNYPSFTENSGDLTATKKIIAPGFETSGTDPLSIEGTATTAANASASTCKFSFNSATNHPNFGCDATTQPAADGMLVSDVLAGTQFPALTGDVTTVQGTLAATVAKVGGAIIANIAKGGMLSGTGAGALGITTAGTDGQVWTADAASAGGAKWSMPSTSTAAVVHGFGGTFSSTGGDLLVAGAVEYMTLPYACTINGWNIVADAGTVSFDIWKVASGTAIPTVSNTIINTGAGGAKPALASGTAVHSTTVSNWTTAVTANDIVAVKLDAVSGAKYVNLIVGCQ